MKLSLSWIRDYVNIPEDADLKKLAYDLTMSTVEVEDVEYLAERFENMITTGSPSPCQRTTAPGQDTATRIPSSRLMPPHTMSLISSLPIFSLHTRSLSAFGCGSIFSITPTIIFSKRSARYSTAQI